MFNKSGQDNGGHLTTTATPFTAARAYSGDFSILYWINPAHTGSVMREVFYASPATDDPLSNGWTLRIDKANNIVRFREDGANRNLAVAGPTAQGDTGLWLYAVSGDWDGANHDTTFMICKLGESSATSVSFNNLSFTDTTKCGFGCIQGSSTADVGNYGMLVVRDHTISTSDIEAICSSGRYSDIVYSTDGNMTGKSGVLFAMGLGITPDLDDIGDAYDTVNNDGLFVYSSYDNARWNDIDGTITSNGSWTHVSPYDQFPGLKRYTPDLLAAASLPSFSRKGTGGAKAAELLKTAHASNTTFLVVGNSRGVRGQSYDDYAQNYGHGFIADDNKVGWVGVDFVPPYDSSANSWAFVSDLNGGTTTGVNVTDGATTAATDFSRWGTNSQYSASLGMGEQVHIGASSSWRWLGDSTWGDLANTDTIEVKTYLLSYPGSGNATVEAATADTQTDTTNDAYSSSSSATLESVAASHTVAAGDTKAVGGLTLQGVTGLSLSVGDACFNETQNDIAVIASVSETTDTVITFDTNLGGVPATNDVLRFGPWSIVTVTDTIVDTGTNDDFKGQRVTHAGTGGNGDIVVLGMGFRATNRTGNILATMGGGGDGAADQIAQEADGNIEAIATAVNPDVVLFTPPTQSSSWTVNGKAYINLLLNAIPNAEYVLLGDPIHSAANNLDEVAPATDLNDWNAGMLNDPLPANAVVLDASRGALIGMPVDRMADGQQAKSGDASHYSTRGQIAFAVEWKRLLTEIVEGGPPRRRGSRTDSRHRFI